jgi:hypothetical protein
MIINRFYDLASLILSPLAKNCRRPRSDVKASQAAQNALDLVQTVQNEQKLDLGASVRGGSVGDLTKEVVVDSSIPASWKNLTAGERFSYNGRIYEICSTLGDGACALHSVFGKKSSGQYSFLGVKTSGKIARENYVATINRAEKKEMIEEYLQDRLVELTTDGIVSSFENQLLASPISKLLKNLKDEISEISNEIAKGKEYRYNAGGIEVLSEALQRSYQSYAKKSEVLDSYLKAVQDSRYYFSDQEIGIMAELFDKKIIIFGESSEKPIVYNLRGSETVCIHFGSHGKGRGHYSRVEVIS